jgi:O-antigen ligase
VTVLAVVVHRDRLSTKPVWLANAPATLLTLYAAWMAIQTPWALDQPTHIEGTVQFIKYLVAFWFVYRIAESKEMLRNILIAHVAGCTLLGIYAQFTGRDGERLDGVGGPGMDDANTLGMYLATGVVIGLGLFLMLKGWVRWAVLSMVIIVLNGFVLANSRGSFLGLSAGLVVLMLCKARAHRRMFWIVVLTGVLSGSMIVDKVFIQRMFTIGDVASQDEDAERSARSRVAIYEAQVRMFHDYPMGAGHRGTATLSPRYLDREWLVRGGADPDAERSSHNTFMTTLVEQGVLGAAMFCMLVLWVLLRIPRLRKLQREGADPELITLGAAMCASLVVVIVAGSATDYLLAEVQFWMYAGLVSMLHMCKRVEAPAAARTATVPYTA